MTMIYVKMLYTIYLTSEFHDNILVQYSLSQSVIVKGQNDTERPSAS